MPKIELTYQQIPDAVKQLTHQEQHQLEVDLRASQPSLEYQLSPPPIRYGTSLVSAKGQVSLSLANMISICTRETASMAALVFVDTRGHDALADT